MADEAKRPGRMWWAFMDNMEAPRRVEGLGCEAEPEAWWVPELGYSIWVGKHLFETEAEALSVAISSKRAKVRELNANIDAMQGRLVEVAKAAE